MPYAESDLAYNRRGDLSPQQIMRLQTSWRQVSRIGIALVILFFVIGIVFYMMGDRAGLIATWAFAMIIILALITFNRVVGRVQAEGEVAMVHGVVQREIEDDEGTKRYFLLVSDLRLMMDETDYPNFMDDQTYCVYYLPRTKYVVSAEIC
ncbi:MAG: hypothetical protein ACFE0Q_14260 [Anaerolineae bacterium]